MSVVLVLAEKDFIAVSGLRFTVRAYKERGKTLVRFNLHGPGRFSPSYFYDSLAGTSDFDREPRRRGRPLSLHNGVPAWTIDGTTMDRVMDWLEAEIGPAPVTPFYDNPDLPF